MPKVLISDKLSPRAAEVFAANGIGTDVATGLTPEQLAGRVGADDGLAVRSATRVTAAVIEAGARLRVIGRAGIGVDNIDVAAASASGIVVMNAPFGNSVTTAEHAIAMMFALARHIPLANQSTHSGAWEKSRFMGTELTGKVLGVVGCGNVGTIVAERGIGLKMKVIAADPYLTPERAASLGVEKVPLEELFARAEVVTLHTPLTDDTAGIVDAASLAQMREGVLIVNCARGELVVEADIREALESGRVGGFAVDVYAPEPPENYSLFGMDRVVATPHLGAATSEAQEKVALQIARQMSDYLNDGAVVNAVNMPSISAEEAPTIRPYMTLARQLGGLAGQIMDSGPRSVTVEYEGHAAGINARPVTSHLLEGLLSPLSVGVNMVNAPILARERGIDVTETRHERSDHFQTLIRLSFATETGSHGVAGTLFAHDRPRVVEIDGIPVEAELGRSMLYFVNRDRPGFIGRLGTALGDAGVNIATFQLGRAGPGGDAVALVEIDGELPAGLIDELRGLPDVVRVKPLSF